MARIGGERSILLIIQCFLRRSLYAETRKTKATQGDSEAIRTSEGKGGKPFSLLSVENFIFELNSPRAPPHSRLARRPRLGQAVVRAVEQIR